MRKLSIMLSTVIPAAAFIAIAGCHERRPGPLERAGSRADEITDNIQEGKPMLHRKGPLEKAGEAIDETFDGKKRK